MSINPKVSVLVPIYNVERYLRQCLESLRAQTLKDIEIILLDDGSTDSCPAICDEFVAQDTRWRVVHKRNSGYGATMNIGLEQARGEFIGIVESDDWVDPDMFESLYELAVQHNVQVAKGECLAHQGNGVWKVEFPVPLQDIDCVLCPARRSAIFYDIACSIWTAIYSRNFLNENGIRFLETPGASYQDISFSFKVLARAKSVWLSSRAFYHLRRDNPGSSVYSNAKIFCVRDEWDEIERYMAQYPEDERRTYLLRLHRKWLTYMWNWSRLDAAGRAAFEPVIVDAFRDAYEKKLLVPSESASPEWIAFCTIMRGNSWAGRVRNLLAKYIRKTIRVFYKRQVREGFITYRILGGLMRFSRKDRTKHLPTFHGDFSA